MFSNFHFFTSKHRLLVTTVILGLFVSSCSDHSSDVAKIEGALCTKPISTDKLLPTIYDQVSKLGWAVNGPIFPERKNDIPMGRSDNQVNLVRSIESGATSVKIKLDISGTIPTAAIILDAVWYAGANEVGRAAPNIVLGENLRNTINTIQNVPVGADRLLLVARPWREIDGILTLGEGEIIWCKK
jgi:hypothetical protein